MSNKNHVEVYFIRHKIKGRTFNDLKKAEKIAILFDEVPCGKVIVNFDKINGYYDKEIEYNRPFFDNLIKARTKHYIQTYKSALKYIWNIGNYGGLVVAEYDNDFNCIVGMVNRNTKIESFPGANNIYNITLQLTGVKKLNYADYPVLLAVRPPYSTICSPHTEFFKTVIPAIYNGKKISIKRYLMHDKMLEQLCLEYLRKFGVNGEYLDYCTLLVGKNLKAVDIAGVSTSGRKIYAQVKTDAINSGAQKDFKAFVKNNSNGLNIIFSKGIGNATPDPSIVYIDVDNVFNCFRAKSIKMLKNMIGFK